MENKNILLLGKDKNKEKEETEKKKVDVPRTTIDMLEQTFQMT